MKKFVLLVAFMLPLSIALISAQNTPSTTKKQATKSKAPVVPSAVKEAFKQRFPQVTKVKFDRERNGEYEAGFKENGAAMSANFTAQGAWRETETEIKTEELPTVVAQAIAAKYPRAKVVGAAKIETADNGTRYEADLKTGLKKSEVLFDAAGNPVK